MVDGRERDEAEGVADGGGVSSDDSMRDSEQTLRAPRESSAPRHPAERRSRRTGRALQAERLARKNEWRDAGLCTKCGKQTVVGSIFCQKHEAVKQAYIEWQEAGKQAYIERQEAGKQAHIERKEAGKHAYIKRKMDSYPTRIERQYAARQANIEWQEHVEEVRWESWRSRSKVYSRDGGHCRYCGVKLDKDGEWHVDHIEPVYRGGGSEMENLALACVDCNLSKMARPPANFLAEMGRGSLAAFLDEPRQRAARDTRNAMIGAGCAFAVGIITFIIVAIAADGDGRFVGGFFAAFAAFVITFIVAALVFQGPRCTTCSAPPVEGASLCGAHLAAQRRARIAPKRRPRRTDRRG